MPDKSVVAFFKSLLAFCASSETNPTNAELIWYSFWLAVLDHLFSGSFGGRAFITPQFPVSVKQLGHSAGKTIILKKLPDFAALTISGGKSVPFKNLVLDNKLFEQMACGGWKVDVSTIWALAEIKRPPLWFEGKHDISFPEEAISRIQQIDIGYLTQIESARIQAQNQAAVLFAGGIGAGGAVASESSSVPAKLLLIATAGDRWSWRIVTKDVLPPVSEYKDSTYQPSSSDSFELPSSDPFPWSSDSVEEDVVMATGDDEPKSLLDFGKPGPAYEAWTKNPPTSDDLDLFRPSHPAPFDPRTVMKTAGCKYAEHSWSGITVWLSAEADEERRLLKEQLSWIVT